MKPEQIKKSFIRNPTDFNVLDYGKLPPQAIEMEEAVLAAVMIENDAINQISSLLKPEIFYVDAHQRLCRAILNLHNTQQKIDLLTVVEQLKKNGDLEAVGGPFFIAQLSNKIASAAHVGQHIRTLLEKFIQRGVISISTEAIKDAYEDTTDPIELLDRAEMQFRSLTNQLLTGEIESLDQQVDEALSQIMMSSEEAKKYHIASKHTAINQYCNGWERETLNIIAARPGMGKSAFAVSETVHLLSQGYKVLWLNPEMSKKQLTLRVIANVTRISNNKIRKKNFNNGEEMAVYDAAHWYKMNRNNLWQNFTAGIQVNHIHNMARKIKLEKGLDVVIIDYLQLITVDPFIARNLNRDQVIGHITRELKAIAKNLQVAVICFCQLSRLTEAKADKRPSLGELRESGNIEQDADTISFLLRPEYYFKRDGDKIIYETPEQEQYKNICQFINAKNRQDSIFEDELYCELGISTFYDTDNEGNKIDGSAPF